jgi:hypothetical protein
MDTKALDLRNKEIRKLHRQNKPAQWIARETGLSLRSVYEIIQDKPVDDIRMAS